MFVEFVFQVQQFFVFILQQLFDGDVCLCGDYGGDVFFCDLFVDYVWFGGCGGFGVFSFGDVVFQMFDGFVFEFGCFGVVGVVYGEVVLGDCVVELFFQFVDLVEVLMFMCLVGFEFCEFLFYFDEVFVEGVQMFF